VGVLKPGGYLDLAEETLGTQCGGQLWVHDLQRYGSVVLAIPTQVDCGHASPPELALEHVAIR
jgi:hypothetical protein